MKTRKQILDFLAKQFSDRYMTVDTTCRIYRSGNRVIIHKVYIEDYNKFGDSPFTPDFETIKELGEYIKEHFKDKTDE